MDYFSDLIIRIAVHVATQTINSTHSWHCDPRVEEVREPIDLDGHLHWKCYEDNSMRKYGHCGVNQLTLIRIGNLDAATPHLSKELEDFTSIASNSAMIK